MTRFFSFDGCDNGFEEHETLDEARRAADSALAGAREAAEGDSWDEGSDAICYGQVLGRVQVKSRYTVEEAIERDDVTAVSMMEESGVDSLVDYELAEVKDDDDDDNDGWISVAKKLPDDELTVLASAEDGDDGEPVWLAYLETLDDGTTRWRTVEGAVATPAGEPGWGPVTHWRNLPAPTKGGRS